MGLFGKKNRAGVAESITSFGGTLPGAQVPATLRVAAVTEPSAPGASDLMLLSGLLLGPFPLQLVQLTAAVPRPYWPSAGTHFPVVADPANPLNFDVDWGQIPSDGVPETLPPSPGPTGWDPGPGGAHNQTAAEWLASQGFTVGDFGGLLDKVAPGLGPLLDQASARYASVIRGQAALQLMQTGERAQGVVSAVQRLSMPLQMLPSPEASMAWLTLDVTPVDGAPYQATIRFGFRSPERFAQLATVGTRLPLRRDPSNPSTVTIDLPALGITPK
jgi:hypothetical protein